MNVATVILCLCICLSVYECAWVCICVQIMELKCNACIGIRELEMRKDH